MGRRSKKRSGGLEKVSIVTKVDSHVHDFTNAMQGAAVNCSAFCRDFAAVRRHLCVVATVVFANGTRRCQNGQIMSYLTKLSFWLVYVCQTACGCQRKVDLDQA